MNALSEENGTEMLLSRVEAADSATLLGDTFYRSYYDRIYRYFSFRLFDKSEAHDLTQTVFLKIFSSLQRGLWDGAGDIHYIFTVARNTLIDYFRQNKHAMIVSTDLVYALADSVTDAGIIDQGQHRELLASAVGKLRKEEGEAVAYRFFADMEYKHIAQIMGKEVCTVRQLVHRGLKSLRGKLESHTHFFS